MHTGNAHVSFHHGGPEAVTLCWALCSLSHVNPLMLMVNGIGTTGLGDGTVSILFSLITWGQMAAMLKRVLTLKI